MNRNSKAPAGGAPELHNDQLTEGSIHPFSGGVDTDEIEAKQTQFLRSFFGQGLANLCIISEKTGLRGETFVLPQDMENAIHFIGTAKKEENVYFTPGNVSSMISSKPKKADIESLSRSWCDIDVKDFMTDDIDYEHARESLLASVDEFIEKYKPTYVVDSGNGRQLFWRLPESLSVEEGEALNRRIVAALGGDKSAVNADRIMAMPYTRKHQSKSKLEAGYPDKILQTSVVFHKADNVLDINLLPETPKNKSTKSLPQQPQPTLDPEIDLSKYHPECKLAWERKLERNETLRNLMDGDNPNGDASAGDLAVCNHMAFMFRGDKDLMDETFRESKRMRPKWDTIHSGERKTYGEMTIDRACLDCKNHRDYPESTFEKLSRRYAMVNYGGQTLIVHIKKDGAYELTKVEDLQKLMSNKYAYDEFGLPIGKANKSGEFKHFKAVADWLDHPQRRTYPGVEFKPLPWKVKDGKFNDGDTLNLYAGLEFTPHTGPCDLIDKHILEIWCDGNSEAYDYIMNWMAMMMQKPAIPAYTVPVLISKEGAGKNIITDILAEAFGAYAALFNSPSDITGQFNESLGIAVFVLLNEATTSDLHGKQSRGVLKSMITDKKLRIEAKYKPPIWLDNCLHIMVTTNDKVPVTMDESDRRFFIMELNNDRRRDPEYFKSILAQIQNGGREAFIHRLLTRDITDFNPRSIPKHCTSTRAEIKDKTRPSYEQFWSDCLHRGEIGGFEEGLTTSLTNEEWCRGTVKIRSTELYKIYSGYAKMRKSDVISHKKFTQFLEGDYVKADSVNSGGRYYIIPCFSDCQESFTAESDGDFDI